jgi:hypothetical protein
MDIEETSLVAMLIANTLLLTIIIVFMLVTFKWDSKDNFDDMQEHVGYRKID